MSLVKKKALDRKQNLSTEEGHSFSSPKVEDSRLGRRKKIFWGLTIGLLIVVFILAAAFLYLNFSPIPGRTNILLLGMTGSGQTGGDLTDTMIFVSVENQTGRIFLLSLPRDIWIVPLRTKVNSIYHYGGLGLAKEAVAEILGQPVDYAVLVDARLFTEIVDFLGGLEIDVERNFDDYRYPVPGKENDDCEGDPEYKCRYEHLHFDAGKQWMGGERALKYVRSRYAEGEEGTDLARNKRQQRLILAVRNKLLSPQFFSDPRKQIRLLRLVLNNIETDVPRDKYFDFFKTAFRFRPEKLKTSVLDDNLLIHPPNFQFLYDGQWVLVPRTGDWHEIQNHLRELLVTD